MTRATTLPLGGELGIGSALGIELEYMIVDRDTLAVRPIADELLRAVNDGRPDDYEGTPVAWSNELVLHVIELKTAGPTASLAGWSEAFQADVVRIDGLLAEHGAMLLPGAMHPTMDPRTETRLWPHEGAEIYSTYDRIFDCKRHGWANLQSCHVNMPFRSDDEFERLHAAIRAVLPLMPALAASSPVLDGRVTGALDSRLDVYLTHQARIPEAMGLVVPEAIRTRDEYEEQILDPLRNAAARLDPDGVLRPTFLNARGAIARFDRSAIEIRVLDVQEAPRCDLAVALLIEAVVLEVASERWAPLSALHALSTERLASVLRDVIRDGDRATIRDPELLSVFGRNEPLRAGALWRELATRVRRDDDAWRELDGALGLVLDEGPLSRRILGVLGSEDSGDGRSQGLEAVWRRLAGCVGAGVPFSAGSGSGG